MPQEYEQLALFEVPEPKRTILRKDERVITARTVRAFQPALIVLKAATLLPLTTELPTADL